jgi:Brp/Blh family beta-carotene 15,15'-monooxygenase
MTTTELDVDLMMAAALICLVGLPHGALDPVVARQHKLFSSLKGGLAFYSLYLLVSLLMVLLWVLSPHIALTLFLAYSALHFGRDWRSLPLGGLPYGVVILGSPAFWRPDEVTHLFSALTFESLNMLNSTSWLTHLLGWSVAPALLFIIVAHCIASSSMTWRLSDKLNGQLSAWCALELICLMSAAHFLAPLAYFTLYFCALHSPKHIISSLRSLSRQQLTQTLWVALLITVLTLLIVASFAWQLRSVISTWSDFTLQAIFIGLAALTVPHMALLEWVEWDTSRERSREVTPHTQL